MTKTPNLFFSCVDSRIQEQGSMYSRFHLGTFVQGQALTFANALRRTLLAETPGLVMKDVSIKGASHEFATLPGVEETVLDIILNLKKLVFAPTTSKLVDLEDFQTTCFLKSRGPGKVSSADLKLPITVKCVNPTVHIVTLTSAEEFTLRFTLELRNPNQPLRDKISDPIENKTRKLVLNPVPMSILKVNYVIKPLNAKQGSEYIVLEVWTDGSLLPQESVQFGLKNLTNLFFKFTQLSKLKNKV